MLRSLVSTARRQRFVALLGVIVLALAVPPAFGASSVTAQIAKALKLAKTANTNATKALTLAKTSSAGATGAKGATGASGATGAAGPAGPAGQTGAAGPAGPTGAKGDKGDTGAQGPQGPAGPAGTSPAGGGLPKALSATLAPSTLAAAYGSDPLTFATPLANTSYVVNAHVRIDNTGGGAANVDCELRSGSTVIDKGSVGPLYGSYLSNISLTGIAPASATPADAHIGLYCQSSEQYQATKASGIITAVSVAS
ncbi:MAG: hypothetical protein AAGC46_14035 [Solirubrobacteraceae bacterium]|nr:hypothetical protein [Patulibacter sp.]